MTDWRADHIEAMREYDRANPLPADRFGPGWPRRYRFLPAAIVADRWLVAAGHYKRRACARLRRAYRVPFGLFVGLLISDVGRVLPGRLPRFGALVVGALIVTVSLPDLRGRDDEDGDW